MANNTPHHPARSTEPASITGITAPESALCTAAALYLMSHYAQCPCPLIAHAIADQLARLSRACADASSLAAQQLAMALRTQWQNIACGNAGTVRH